MTLTAQQIFDTVATHLLQQGRKAVIRNSEKSESCRYRTPEGLKCAVGCLIEDEEYQPEMEGRGVHTLAGLGLLPSRLSPFVDLLKALQRIHDYRTNAPSFKASVVNQMKRLAPEHGLDTSVLDQYKETP